MSVLKNNSNKVLKSQSNSVAVGVIEISSVPNCVFDVDLSTQTGYVDNQDIVAGLTDNISGNNLVPMSADYFKYKKSTGLNNYPSADRVFTSPVTSGLISNSAVEAFWFSDITFFIVVKFSSINSYRIFSSGAFGNNTKGWEIVNLSNGLFIYRELLNFGTLTSPFVPYGTNGTVIAVNIKRGGLSYFNVNGNRVLMSSNTPAYNPSIYSAITIGRGSTPGGSDSYDFKFEKMRIYNRALTAKEENGIVRNLMFKYGIK